LHILFRHNNAGDWRGGDCHDTALDL